jgi:formate hydrogenlyase transcriptional activator
MAFFFGRDEIAESGGGGLVMSAPATVIHMNSRGASQPGKPGAVPVLKRYETLLEVAGSIVSQVGLSDLFRDLLQRLKEVDGFDFLNLVLHDPIRNTMRLNVLQALIPVTIPMSLELPVGDSPAGWVWQNQKPLLLPDLTDENRFGPYIRMLRDSGIRTYYVLPLTIAKQSYGAVSFGSRQVNAYSDSELKFMEQLAMQIAVAVDVDLTHETAHTYQEQLAKEHERLRLVHDITNTLVSHIDAKELFREISKCIGRVMQHDYCSLCLHEPSSNQIRLRAVDFPKGGNLLQEDTVFPVEDSPAGRAIATNHPLLINRLSIKNFPSKATQLLLDSGIKSGCWLPLAGRKRFLGTLGICGFQESAFSQGDLDLLSEVANQVAIAVDNALAFEEIAELKDKLAEEKFYLEDEIRTEHNFEEIIGESATLKHVLQQVETVARTDSTVMILGETGTGKELIARAIHNLSNRRDRALVKLNCAAIPTGLLESDLFGHERGAFTGAIAQKIGRVELADKGTLFLDEVGDIPPELQPKLLRVLQEQEFERLGGTRTIHVNARLVVATNRDLDKMVAQREFRQDLFYRLNIFPIQVPPLRERTTDIPLLVNFFVNKHAKRIGKRIQKVPAETMRALVRWHWPGNVRELENVVERALILSQGPVLNVSLAELKGGLPTPLSTKVQTLEASEKQLILGALREANGVIAGAAGKLGMKRTTLNSKMRKLHVSRSDLFSA